MRGGDAETGKGKAGSSSVDLGDWGVQVSLERLKQSLSQTVTAKLLGGVPLTPASLRNEAFADKIEGRGNRGTVDTYRHCCEP